MSPIYVVTVIDHDGTEWRSTREHEADAAGDCAAFCKAGYIAVYRAHTWATAPLDPWGTGNNPAIAD